MGDSRSWAAEMEDEIVECKFGIKRKYFDTCTCDGCEMLRDRAKRIEEKAKEVYYEAHKVFSGLKEEDWDKISSIKVKKTQHKKVQSCLESQE